MKKNIARGSMLAVAALSIMMGGTSYTSTSNLKREVSNAPAVIGKAIENTVDADKTLARGVAVQEVAEVVATEAVTEATTEAVTEEATVQAVMEEVVEEEVEHKKAVLNSNQVVANIASYLNIRSDASEEAEVIGKFYNGNVGTIVEKGEQWSLVSSGNAYGYVNNDYLLFGEEAEAYIENNCDQVAKVTADTLNVRAEESTESDIVSLTDAGDTLTILGEDNGWFKVAVTQSDEEGVVEDKVGYVSGDYVYVDYVYETAVTIEEEEAALAAEEAANEEAVQTSTTEVTTTEAPVAEAPTTEAPKKESPKKNKPKKEESSKNESKGSATGQDVADYAVQFVGCPYVYGGTSLTEGADCSGFVQSVYKHFGYSLSRTSYSQPNDGTKVSVKDIKPGDLLFYHNFGHVAIYIGGGEVVHASNKKSGIKISNYDYAPIDKAVRIIN